MQPNFYQSFDEASESNWKLLQFLFSKYEDYVLNEPKLYPNQAHQKCTAEDGYLTIKEKYYILMEVKRRQFNDDVLKNRYSGTFFLEEDKYKYLHKKMKYVYNDKPNNKIWYLNKTLDGFLYIFDITYGDYIWKTKKMNRVTYSKYQKKVNKRITELNIENAIFSKNLKIIG